MNWSFTIDPWAVIDICAVTTFSVMCFCAIVCMIAYTYRFVTGPREDTTERVYPPEEHA